VIALFDASAIIPLLVDEEQTIPARAAWQASSQRMTIDLAGAEVANALWRKVKNNALSAETARAALSAFFAHSTRRLTTDADCAAALALAMRLDHPVYDCLYAIAAQREGARLVTADRRFADRLAGEPVEVLLLDA